MKKPSIPGVSSLSPEMARVLEPVKANIEIITGARPGSASITPLQSDATLTQVIAQLNLILSRIEHSG